MSKQRKSYNEQLAEIYAKIPNIDCKKKCQIACSVIPLERPELKKIRKRTPIDIENFVIRTDEGVHIMFDAEKERCPLLGENGDCTVYDVRPFVCRLFGVVRGMACPEGCVPERWLEDTEVAELVTQIRQLK